RTSPTGQPRAITSSMMRSATLAARLALESAPGRGMSRVDVRVVVIPGILPGHTARSAPVTSVFAKRVTGKCQALKSVLRMKTWFAKTEPAGVAADRGPVRSSPRAAGPPTGFGPAHIDSAHVLARRP